jgi:uncharacterized protein YdcH (DUF465 family)
MRVDELKKEMDAQFARVGERFAQVDERFVELEQRIETEAHTTRRHFDVVAEQMKADAKLTLEAITAMDKRMAGFMAANAAEHAHFSAIASEHEARLKA